MKKIICTTKCFDGRKVYDVGEFKLIDDNAQVPAYFRLDAEAPRVEAAAPKRFNPMEPVTYKINQPVVPRGGMATGLSSAPIKAMPTAGSIAAEKAQEKDAEETSVLQPLIKRRGRPRAS